MHPGDSGRGPGPGFDTLLPCVEVNASEWDCQGALATNSLPTSHWDTLGVLICTMLEQGRRLDARNTVTSFFQAGGLLHSFSSQDISFLQLSRYLNISQDI